MDWFDWGLFGGFFGKDIVQFLRRYKLRLIFLMAVLGVELFLFFSMVRTKGWTFAWHRMIEMALTPVGIFVPLGIGALCVVGMVLCAPDLIGKPKDGKSNKSETKKKA
jgi:hypothetical protein